MKARVFPYVDELRSAHELRREAIARRLDEFAAVQPEDYFYELAYCLLTPQSSAVNAGKAIASLQSVDFLNNEIDAAKILFRKEQYIRFHNTKAKRLQEAKNNFATIAQVLNSRPAGTTLRAWLVANVNGLGWKEASHFLRNIGYRDLAILDRHILKNLVHHRVIRAVPKTLSTKRYLSIEEQFKRFAEAIGISMDELDLIFWSNETGEILK